MRPSIEHRGPPPAKGRREGSSATVRRPMAVGGPDACRVRATPRERINQALDFIRIFRITPPLRAHQLHQGLGNSKSRPSCCRNGGQSSWVTAQPSRFEPNSTPVSGSDSSASRSPAMTAGLPRTRQRPPLPVHCKTVAPGRILNISRLPCCGSPSLTTLAGYEDLNDTDRPRSDEVTFRWTTEVRRPWPAPPTGTSERVECP